jgi:DNA-binding NarL/FixJ family response regulator
LTKQILVVDDSKAVRDAIRFLLRSQPELAICGEAQDGVGAIEKAQKLRPDLILLDLAMPNLNGAIAASILKRTLPGTPIILFTMYEQAVDALASAIGVDIVLSKPDGLDHLLEMISGLIDPRGEQNNDRFVEND